MRKTIAAIIFALSIALASGCAGPASGQAGTSGQPAESGTLAPSGENSPDKPPAAASPRGVLMMATTTSTDNTGLLDYLAPIFLEDTGWELKWTAVGTGEALKLGMDGEVDVVLVHDKEKEEAFVRDGYGEKRFDVMYNDFVVVGPKDGPIAHTGDVGSVFRQIAEKSLVFVSRGDDSGTHSKELSIWKGLGIDCEKNPNYISAGAGMSDTLIMADEKQGYCLSDRGTYLAVKNKAEGGLELVVVCEGAPELRNEYGVIAVSPEKHPDVNYEAAKAFIEWICSPKVQKLIGEYGVDKYGEPLFTPNAAR